jgi:hypothetical protein
LVVEAVTAGVRDYDKSTLEAVYKWRKRYPQLYAFFKMNAPIVS